jgi:DNA polymerase III subunit beta
MLQFTANQWDLAEGLSHVIGAVEKKTTMPILSRVLVSSNGSGIVLRATDLEVTVETHVAASVNGEGALAIPGQAFMEYVKRLSGEIVVKATPTMRASVSAGTSKSNIAGNQASEFPDMAAASGDVVVTVDGVDLVRMITETSYVIEKEAIGGVGGALLKLQDGELTMLTKSATRMALSRTPVDSKATSKWPMSERALGQLKLFASQCEKVDILESPSAVFFRSGDRSLSARLLGVGFPDITRILQAKMPHAIRVNKREFRSALDRVMPFTADAMKINVVAVDVSGTQMKLTAANHDLGDVEEIVTVDYSGPDLSSRFKTQYLIDPIGKVSGEEVILRHSEEHKGNLKIEGPNDTFVYFCAEMRAK